jgi:predicted exporter
VLITVSVGFLYAFLTCFFLFPKVYILTLAFGTSLIGMSVDYCLYWLTSSIDDLRNPFARRRYLIPGMLLAFLTTLMGYCLMAITPFPVLSQMAVFSIGGITSSWLAVVLVFPYIKKLNFNSNATYSLVRYIRPGFFHDFPAFRYLFISLIILLSFYGVFTFKVNDDIRLLSNFDKNLINQQVQVSKILDIPSPFQFFIVTGDSEADALNRADSLSKNLDQLVSDGYISGYQSITQYVPSLDAQTIASKAYDSTNRTLALEKISKEMDMDDQWFRTINQINLPLTLADLRNLPIYKKLSYLWIDSQMTTKSTAILLMGVRGPESVEQLSKLIMPNVIWVDKPQEISNIFQRYRTLFSYIVMVGYFLTFLALYAKYKMEAWRAILPPIFATFMTLCVLNLMGETVGLLTVIAFALLLGVGTDYGIFLLQYPNDRKVLFSISIAALMTLISFGSLSFSSVPALHGFGITLFLGVFLSWLLTIFFARRSIKYD